MAGNEMQLNKNEISEGLFNADLWNPLDCHLLSYVKSPVLIHFLNSKTTLIGRALCHGIVDFLDHISNKPNEYVENETTVIGTEHRLYHCRLYTFPSNDNEYQYSPLDSIVELEISSLAPTVFHRLREDIGISNIDFLQSFSKYPLKDFTNPGKSGSVMYKTSDDLFILKTLRAYEARLLMQILSGYHLQLAQRPTLLNRYVGLYLIRFPTLISSIETYIVVMVNAFTPSLQVNEIFDLKGSTIKRKLEGNLCKDHLHKLKDLDFLDFYPHGIRIPSNIYRCLHQVISNDVKVLKKLRITDYSLILGIRHIDATDDDLMQRRPSAGISALFHMSHRLALMHLEKLNLCASSSIDLTSLPVSYLKPLEMLKEEIDSSVFYKHDLIAGASFPIPGIINQSGQRVYIYLAIVDMLQTYDSFKYIEQKLKKITDPSRHHQYSVIEPDEYEKRILTFLFEHVFLDAGDDFQWNTIEESKPDSFDENNGTNKKTIDGDNSRLKMFLKLRL